MLIGKQIYSSVTQKTYSIQLKIPRDGLFEGYFCCDDSNDQIYTMIVGKSSETFQNEYDHYENKINEQRKRYFIQIFDVFSINQNVFFVMESFQINLRSFLIQRKFMGVPLKYVACIMKQLIEALPFRSNHSYLTPSNIVIVNNVHIKIIDFTDCILKIDNNQNLSNLIHFDYYKAPEVASSEENTDKGDIWSLGCIASELYLGLPIFAVESHSNIKQVIKTRLEHCDEEAHNIYPAEVHDLARYKNPRLLDNILKINFNNETKNQKLCFYDFLQIMLKIDPNERSSSKDLINHDFIQLFSP